MHNRVGESFSNIPHTYIEIFFSKMDMETSAYGNQREGNQEIYRLNWRELNEWMAHGVHLMLY